MEEVMNHFFYKGICFIPLSKEEIIRSDFLWDGKSHPVGSKFERLGSSSRQSLCIGWNLIYEGRHLNFVLFSHDAPRIGTQTSLFAKPQAFIAILYLDDQNLMMPSGTGTFYDIVP